ncbi:hypothetical protein [Mucilaginibacter arboris]|uniref:Beta-1,6-galactofuranosyltransferase n=1 Tax=Mucilaginibacter arboris TaxID=2682090 RepID=A0A7K1SUK3_9SPHI|nr:hypothetical protein [Mucilaginibacter arboris]MVN21006.1 hypothetical protein [Mucilaginibacter arboris]
MKYHIYINVINNELKHAGNKAVNDCTKILEKQGYELIQLNFYKHKYLIFVNLIKILFQLIVIILKIKPRSLIIIQYPLFGLKGYFKVFIKLLKFRDCFFACMIHDLDSLRFQKSNQKVSYEISNLNAYDVLITHNDNMTQWLKSKSIKAEIIVLGIFDYLYTNENEFNRLSIFSKGKKDVVIAGNLAKGEYIYDLDSISKNIYFRLYGPGLNLKRLEKQEHVIWEGTFSAEDLVEKLKGSFGLIWDGNNIEQCDGLYGNYIAYNNPHKISLYLASGLPVILPNNAALSKFVLENGIGIVINNLIELSDIIDKINVDQYEAMLKNIDSIKSKLKVGYFFQTAIEQTEAIYNSRISSFE